jgi:hypothetical protein
MSAALFWKTAIPYYLKVSLRFSMLGLVGPLAITLASALRIGLTEHRLAVNPVGVEYAFALGGFFFLFALLTAVGDDVRRNWDAPERTVAWNPLLMWRMFLYLVAMVFFVAAFLAYHQGLSLSVGFIVFGIGSAITAKKCF